MKPLRRRNGKAIVRSAYPDASDAVAPLWEEHGLAPVAPGGGSCSDENRVLVG